jgi:hypothetical protein
MKSDKRRKVEKTCPACAGTGAVCCETWAEVRAGAGEDLEFGELGIPLWPLSRHLEMPHCPFCGKSFDRIGRRP